MSNKTNPYRLVYYKRGWSEARRSKNNSLYWKWEFEHNGFDPSIRKKP